MDHSRCADLLGVELDEFVLRGSEADAQAVDLTEPALALRLGNPGDEVVADLFQAGPFVRVNS
ncbi:hypothetical protein [Streptomyces mirabilis]|uniref:hypothetical protein n=1 Tax=Streptomyces mirabilis TaxID=68239 RepID=UPI0036462B17